ncbi:MAG: N-formylglutamate deformylase [Bacteriovoracaceae bacterium]|jgi:N-formylglutamate deformylase|nr:N-formylglutamate deformylase [Bacteriovoracaceae bacterium]
MKREAFIIKKPAIITKPLLVSVPHSGVYFPEEIIPAFNPKYIKHPEDTDWFVDQLYDFCTEMGIVMIRAPYSRYVIDLNRDIENEKLYSDKRSQTSLVPLKSFKQESLYNQNMEPDQSEINRRIDLYYKPYYKQVDSLLLELKNQFTHALLFDCHSIGRNVPSIQKEDFPDLILGNNDKTSAHESIISIAMAVLNASDYSVKHNEPFKGGQITRNFGQPSKGIHALQLEMSQDVYMNTEKNEYSYKIKPMIRPVLKELFEQLCKEMGKLSS